MSTGISNQPGRATGRGRGRGRGAIRESTLGVRRGGFTREYIDDCLNRKLLIFATDIGQGWTFCQIRKTQFRDNF